MRLLLLAELRFLARAPWSAATAVFGVALAVASIVAVHQIAAAVSRSLDAARPPHLAGITHLLERPTLTADAYFGLRAAWRAERWPGVVALVPIVEGQVVIDAERTRVLGADWLAYPARLGEVEPSAADSPRFDDAPGQTVSGLPVWRLLDGTAVAAVRDRQLAPTKPVGPEVGDTIAVEGMRLEVVGLVDGGLGPMLFADIATAQRMLRRGPAAVDYIGLAARDPWAGWRRALDALMPGFAAGLPEPQVPDALRAAGFGARAIGSEQPATEFARAILFNVGALGLLALLVAWFLVHQVALIWVERQRPIFARLHALGAPHASLAAGFVALFALLGILATLLGTVAGLWLAEVLIRLSAPDATGNALRGDPEPILFAKAACSGIGVCVAAGWLAFRSDVRGRPGQAWARPVLIVVAAVALVGGIVAEETGLLGGFAAILAASALALVAIRPLLAWLRSRVGRACPRRDSRVRRWPIAAQFARLAVREAVWRPEVVSVALAALALAVATSMGIGLMVESLRVDFARMLEARLAGDLYARGPTRTVAAAAEWLEGKGDVLHVGRYGEAQVRVARAVGAAAAAEPIAVASPALLGYGAFDATEAARYGHDAALAPHEILVNERLARLLGVGPGSTVAVGGVVVDGSVEGKAAVVFAVAEVFPGFGDVEPRLMMDTRGLAALGLTPAFDRLSVRRERDGAAATADRRSAADPTTVSVQGLSGALAERFPDLDVTEREALRRRAFEVFDRTFAVTRALTLLALLVAGVGVYNALTALRLTQAPTRRLLEAQGAAARELAFVTLIRSATVGVLAVVVALPLGLAMAWLLCRVINPRAFGWTIELHLVPQAWLLPLVLGLVATVLAGLLPAPRERGGLDEAA